MRLPALLVVGCLHLVAIGAVVYLSVRFLERRTLRSLPPVADVLAWSLPHLYRQTTRAERARLRTRRRGTTESSGGGNALDDCMKIAMMRVIGWVPTRSYRGVRTEQALMRAMVTIDRVVDDDCPPTSGTREAFFAHVTRVLHGLRDRQGLRGEGAMPEDLPLLYTVRACRELLGFDPLPKMLEVWGDYGPDAARIIRGEAVADRSTIERAHGSYTKLHVLAGLMLGLDAERARLFAELDVPVRTAFDTLADLPRDSRMGQLALSGEELAAAGISPEELLSHASSWEELAHVPHLAEWFVNRANELKVYWGEEALPRLETQVAPTSNRAGRETATCGTGGAATEGYKPTSARGSHTSRVLRRTRDSLPPILW